MQYDMNGNRIYGEFTDQFGTRVIIKAASAEHVLVAGKAQVRISQGDGAMYAYPKREDVAALIDALTSYMAATDGVPDLPEPEV